MSAKEAADDVADDYLRVWNAILNAILGWNEAQVARWEDTEVGFVRASDEIRGPMMNEGPENLAARALIPEDVIESDNPTQYRHSARRIGAIIARAFNKAHDIRDVNWRIVRSEIDTVLSERGYSLAELVQQKRRLYRS